jgi:hypothetical protein
MKRYILFFIIIPSLSFANGNTGDMQIQYNDKNLKKGFYLKQVDIRHRAGFSVSIPGAVRLRLRPFYEYRYSAEKEVIPINKNQ